MKQTPWFERHFTAITDTGLFPALVERLEGTPHRLTANLKGQDDHVLPENQNKWSLKKEIGHLIDLEPLWYARCQQIIRGEKNLITADLTNKKTDNTDHDASSISDLIATFKRHRENLILSLKRVSSKALLHTAIHPRLGTPMSLMDLTFFIAEHDDHHLVKISRFVTKPGENMKG